MFIAVTEQRNLRCAWFEVHIMYGTEQTKLELFSL
jgi:hypothetical protein